MNKTILKYVVACVAFCTVCMANAQVSVNATIDSTQIFIGQQVGVTLVVNADADNKIELPKFDSLAQIVPGLEVVTALPTDTDRLNDGKRLSLTKKYILTSFDTALYRIPPLDVLVDGKKYSSKSLALKVYTFDIDTLHVDSIYGIKAEMSPDFSWEDWYIVMWMALAVCVCIVAILLLVYAIKANKPIFHRIRIDQKLAPHKEAMKRIDEIKQSEIAKSEDSKEYYTLLTDTLRQYISRRFGFNAMEMTSYEIISQLKEVSDDDAIRELTDLFQTADLVKFAKYSTQANENDRNLVNAIDYINNTKKEEDEEVQPVQMVVEDKMSKRTRQILVAAVCVVGIVLLVCVVVAIRRVVFNLT